MNDQLEALQNAAISVKLDGLVINEKTYHDRRVKTQKFYLTLNGTSISPVLNYDNMNHFILGFSKANKLFNHSQITTL